jgi:post-segregation antitoxin (ccd killing protein)
MKRTNITIPKEVQKEARELGINVSATAVRALEIRIKACKEAEKIE